jgi:ABC-2 type transport system ATP-binding protein
MIQLANICKRYRTRGKDFTWRTQVKQALGVQPVEHLTALDGIDINIKKGEIFGILGPNGAGKTTLIKIVAGLLLPEEGMATVNGFDIIDDREKVRTSVNILMSGGWIIFDYKLTVAFNLRFWGVMQGLPLSEARQRVDEVLRIVGLFERRNDFPENLSAGLRQKMNLARCLLTDRPIYLLDEPTSNLDPFSADFVRGFVEGTLKREGKTIVLATHNLWEAETICDRIAILHKGHILIQGETKRIVEKLGKEKVVLEVGEASRQLVEELSSLVTVENVVAEQNTLQILGTLRRDLPEIFDVCRKYTEIRNVDLKTPSLNEIFLNLIGEGGEA